MDTIAPPETTTLYLNNPKGFVPAKATSLRIGNQAIALTIVQSLLTCHRRLFTMPG
jgi:hypothetical protein